MTGDPIVQVAGLRKSFGSTTVLRGVDAAVPRGTIFALLGPNGAGKTTVINILSTLVRPDEGSATVAGHDVVREPAAVRRAISLTGQFAAVDELLTGRENLAMMARLNRVPRSSVSRVVDDMLERFDFVDAAGQRAVTYSGGMRRRLDIAISVLARPEVLFLDEPTTGLDPRSRQGVWTFIRELVADGVTVLLTTQYLDEADRLADQIAVLDHGRIIAEGSPTELKRRVGQDVVDVRFVDGSEQSIPTDGSVSDVRRVLARIDEDERSVDTLGIRSPSLDDVFLTLTGKPAEAANTTDGAAA